MVRETGKKQKHIKTYYILRLKRQQQDAEENATTRERWIHVEWTQSKIKETLPSPSSCPLICEVFLWTPISSKMWNDLSVFLFAPKQWLFPCIYSCCHIQSANRSARILAKFSELHTVCSSLPACSVNSWGTLLKCCLKPIAAQYSLMGRPPQHLDFECLFLFCMDIWWYSLQLNP